MSTDTTVLLCIGIAGWAAIIAGGLWYGRKLAKWNKSQDQRLAKVEGKIGFRDGEVVREITEDLDSELERSATLTEMRKAKRRTLPRENAGPPARVGRMKFHRD